MKLTSSPDPEQSFGTAGIAPMERPSVVTRFFMAVVAWAEGLNLKYARLGNLPVYDTATSPWAVEIEKAAPAIRQELERVLVRKADLPSFQDISTDVKTIFSDSRVEELLPAGLRGEIRKEYRSLPRDMEGRAEDPRAVLDLRAGQESARASGAL